MCQSLTLPPLCTFHHYSPLLVSYHPIPPPMYIRYDVMYVCVYVCVCRCEAVHGLGAGPPRQPPVPRVPAVQLLRAALLLRGGLAQRRPHQPLGWARSGRTGSGGVVRGEREREILYSLGKICIIIIIIILWHPALRVDIHTHTYTLHCILAVCFITTHHCLPINSNYNRNNNNIIPPSSRRFFCFPLLENIVLINFLIT